MWFTADSKRILVGDSLGSLHVYDLERSDWVFDAKAHTDRLQSGVVSADGKTLYIGSFDRTVSVWDVATLTLRFRIADHDTRIGSMALSHDGRWLLTAEEQRFVHVRRADTGERQLTLVLPEEARATTASFSPDDRTIITRSHDGVVRTYHAGSGALLASVDTLPVGKIFSSAVRPDGRQLVTVGISGSARVWRMGDPAGYRILDIETSADVMPSVFSGDGARIVTGDLEGAVRIFDSASGTRLSSFMVPGNVNSMATNVDGSLVLSAGDLPTSLPPGLWDASVGTRLADLTGHVPGKMVYDVAVSADGSTFASAGYDGQLRLFDVDDMKLQQSLQIEEKLRLTAVAFRNDGRELAVTNASGVVHFVDRLQNRLTRSIQAHPTWIQDVVYSPDGRRLLTCGRQDQMAKVWDVATGKLELGMTSQAQIMRGGWSPDGRFLATAGSEHTAVIWDAATGEAVRKIHGAEYTAEFSPDGRELLTTGPRGYAVLWDTSLDERSPRELSAFVAERSPWQLTGGRLQLRTDPTAPPR
ncbi:MAG: WD40 repeat domain-containing protein [Polyangiaceae bacterium]